MRRLCFWKMVSLLEQCFLPINIALLKSTSFLSERCALIIFWYIFNSIHSCLLIVIIGTFSRYFKKLCRFLDIVSSEWQLFISNFVSELWAVTPPPLPLYRSQTVHSYCLSRGIDMLNTGAICNQTRGALVWRGKSFFQ